MAKRMENHLCLTKDKHVQNLKGKKCSYTSDDLRDFIWKSLKHQIGLLPQKKKVSFWTACMCKVVSKVHWSHVPVITGGRPLFFVLYNILQYPYHINVIIFKWYRSEFVTYGLAKSTRFKFLTQYCLLAFSTQPTETLAQTNRICTGQCKITTYPNIRVLLSCDINTYSQNNYTNKYMFHIGNYALKCCGGKVS
jgi:hypothetical protein